MKKKKALRIVATAMGLTMAVGLVCGCLAGCGSGADALILGTDLPDGVFNPFFYTSGTDGDIVGQTMIGMISTDKDGQIVAGPDEPCVAYDYSVVTTGNKSVSNEVDGINRTYYTDYYFAIKDNIVFSDGTPLTKKDVLFNIYMYLDPAYTGSATMYSVDIQGLQAYRTQTVNASDQQGFEQLLATKVKERLDPLIYWTDNQDDYENGLTDQQKEDIVKVEQLFRDELDTDWNTAMSSDLKDYEKYVDENGNRLITEYWEIFLYNYGLITLTTKKETDSQTGEITKKWYERSNGYDTNTATDKATLTTFVFSYMLGGKEGATKSYKDHLKSIITVYATANTFQQYLRGEAIKDLVGDNMKVRTVSGITMESMSALPTDVNGGTRDLGKTYDVLHIRINGEDPKAIQNFGFTVAPMHYYSSTADKFSLTAGSEYFGVEFGDSEFMDSIRVIQVPLGAGPYRASTADGNPPADLNELKNSKSKFFSDNIVYLESNENFMLGAPKIKKLCYKVINTSLLYESVKTGEINFASPSATNEMIENLSGKDRDDLDYISTENLGYGYIGINASFVQDLNIRKAIMSAMDTSLCIGYYGSGDLATAIHRPMSTVLKDYYPEGATSYYPYDKSGDTAKYYASEANYQLDSSDGFLKKNGNGERLKFTFTIAGDSEDHPAYSCMVNAAEILNAVGFDITVTRDSTALSKLAAGRLEVWAAAWSSSSDPDMYQVYHKDSSATSILAWGFPWIESADPLTTNSTVQDQKDLLEELARRIEQGRQTTVVEERKKAYSVSTGSDMSKLCALDLVMELAVELPTYQRKALFVYPRGLFDDATLELFKQSTAFQSPLSRIWEVNFD